MASRITAKCIDLNYSENAAVNLHRESNIVPYYHYSVKGHNLGKFTTGKNESDSDSNTYDRTTRLQHLINIDVNENM